MKIVFYPDSDLEDFAFAIKEYEEVWEKDGERIIEVWQKITGLKFTETYINAIVFNNRSAAHPLSLRFNIDFDRKKSVLVHELGHRILYKKVVWGAQKSSLNSHRFLYLVLYDVLIELYGDEFTKRTIEWDSNLGVDYKNAWEWALAFSKDDRLKKFQEILDKGYNAIDEDLQI